MTPIEVTGRLPARQVLAGRVQTVQLDQAPRRFYHHGWQSWSLAAWLDAPGKLPLPGPESLYTSQHDPQFARDPRPHGSWLGAVELVDGSILLLGSLGLDARVRLDGLVLEGRTDSGAGDWLLARGSESSVFAAYAEELVQRFGRQTHPATPRVWCSWYSLYTTIDEQILSRIFDGLADLPFDVLQVDDGWQVAIGDWQPNEKFQSGMAALAGRIRSTGRRAGLWLAPLIAVRSSGLFREHADWFLKDERGKPVSAGINWGEPLYGLDTTRPDVRDWLATLMQQVRAWGFDYVKLDFLYGAALPAKRHQDMPPEAAYRDGLKVMRAALGQDAYLLACGAPILPTLGLCDALRVGPDVSAEWENRRDAGLLQNPTTPAARNALRSTLHRLWLRPLADLDPDVAYFRAVECALSDEQKALLQDIGLICNFKASSDLPQWLSEPERGRLRTFLEQSPTVEQLDRYRFNIGGRQVDFASAAALPPARRGWSALQGRLLGWLADRPAALKLFDALNKRAWQALRARAEESWPDARRPTAADRSWRP